MSTSPPRAYGAPALHAHFRVHPEDFVVEEIAGFDASGVGEHLLLTVEKRGMNTGFAAKRIAAWAGVPEMAIGYAGMKDRHAVTRQRFSVHLPGRESPALETLQTDDLRVIDCARHSRKLPRGALAGNRFELTLREVTGDRDGIESRLNSIATRGVPNYFGEQRFGRGGDNLNQALAMFGGRRVRREERGVLLSAARSELFNRVLGERVLQGCWDSALDGEVWMLDGRRSIFGPEPFGDALAARVQVFDVHPTGPMWGRGTLRCEGACRELELAVLSRDPAAAAVRDGLERAGLEQERRALRMRPAQMRWNWPQSDVLQLEFELQPGCYATSVLTELGEVTSAAAFVPLVE